MKKMIKKMMTFVLLIAMVIVFVGCDLTQTKSITISFETNGGSTIESIELNEDTITSFALPEEPTKEGYDFIGWYLDAEFTNAYDAISIENGNITLYAKWQVQKTAKELNEERIVGSWTATGTSAEFKEDKTCVITLVSQEINGKYDVDGDGNVTITVNVIGFNLNYSGKLDDTSLTLNIGPLSYTLTKTKTFDYELISIPDLSKLVGVDCVKTFKNSFDLNINMIDHEATNKAKSEAKEGETVETIYKDLKITIKLDYTADIKIEKFFPESLEDFKAKFVIDGTFTALADGVEVEDEEYKGYKEAFEHFEIAIKDSFIYVSFNMPTFTEVEGQKTCQLVPMKIKLDFATVLAMIQEYVNNTIVIGDTEDEQIDIDKVYEDEVIDGYESEESDDLIAFLSGLDIDFTNLTPENINDVVDQINKAFNEILVNLYTVGLNDEKINSIIETIDNFRPVVVTEGVTSTITISKENLVNALKDLSTFMQDNQILISMAAMTMTQETIDPDDYQEMIDGINEAAKTVETSTDIKSFEIKVVTDDAKEHIKSIDNNIEVTIYLSDSKKSYFSFTDNGTLSVKAINVTIDFDDYADYEDYTDLVVAMFNDEFNDDINIEDNEGQSEDQSEGQEEQKEEEKQEELKEDID